MIEANNLHVDNSSLTGESEPQPRSTEPESDLAIEAKNLAFFGTLVVEGSGVGLVTSVGNNTVMGRIASLVSGLSHTETPMAKEITNFVHVITAVAVVLSLGFFALGVLLRYQWIEAIVFFISIMVANVPEGLPATVTVSLALTARKMAKNNCLVKTRWRRLGPSRQSARTRPAL